MKMEFAIFIFAGEEQANQALNELRLLKKEGVVELLNATVLVKSLDGRVVIKQMQYIDRKNGALFGSIVGGLVGFLGNIPGAIVGAATGAGIGTVSAQLMNLGFPASFLKELQDQLNPGNSALATLIEDEKIGKITAILQDLGGSLLHCTIEAGAPVGDQLIGIRLLKQREKTQERRAAKINKLNAEIKDLEAKAATSASRTKRRIGERLAQLRSEREKVLKEIGQLFQRRIHQLGVEIVQTRTVLLNEPAENKANLEMQLSRLNTERGLVRARLQANLEAQIKTIRAEIRDSRMRAAQSEAGGKAEIDGQITGLCLERDAVHEQLQQILEEHFEELNSEIKELQAQATTAQAKRRDRLNTCISDLGRQREAVWADLEEEMEEQLQDWNTEIDALSVEIAVSRADVKSDLNTRCVDLIAKQNQAKAKLQLLGNVRAAARREYPASIENTPGALKATEDNARG